MASLALRDGECLRDTPSASRLSARRVGAMATERAGTWLPEAGKLELGSCCGPRMLSPERLALTDYEYLGRSFLQLRGRKAVQTNEATVWEGGGAGI